MKDCLYKIKFYSQTAIVFSTSYINPTIKLAEIEVELAANYFTGLVYFDLTLTVGTKSFNRFLSLEFDGNIFNRKSCLVVKPCLYLISKSLKFYQLNYQLLESNLILFENEKSQFYPTAISTNV